MTERQATCPVCGAGGAAVFFELAQTPVNVCVQWATREEALGCARGDIRLAFCEQCGFVWNEAFDAGLLDYSQAYENSLFCSEVYEDYTRQLLRRLIDTYGLDGKTMIDIGCGKGDFLYMFCELSGGRGIGFDTSYEAVADDRGSGERVEIIRDFYSEAYKDYQADVVCSRYVFEHIEDPGQFLRAIRSAIGERGDTVVYFEVPNVSLILRELCIWDIIYEHCCYFGASALGESFERNGFEVLDVYEGYGGQFLAIEARVEADGSGSGKQERGQGCGGELERMRQEVGQFRAEYEQLLARWRERLADLAARGKRAVLWGAGSKGVGLLNALGVTEQIRYIVDINPRKDGKYVAGTGQQIVGPAFLRQERPDVIILANPIYYKEVAGMVGELGLEPEFI